MPELHLRAALDKVDNGMRGKAPGGSWRNGIAAIGLAAILVVVGAPLVGWPAVVRLPAVLVPALILVLLLTRPWRWPELDRLITEWQPSASLVWRTAGVAGLLLFWYVVTRFQSGQINAVDFTIYYDRPCFQTVQGRPLLVEISGGGVLACAAALTFVLNDNTARTLNYGFHPEVLYAGLIPWIIDAGLGGARRPFLMTVLACVLVKEERSSHCSRCPSPWLSIDSAR